MAPSMGPVRALPGRAKKRLVGFTTSGAFAQSLRSRVTRTDAGGYFENRRHRVDEKGARR
jgi:hypothetical protein